ncbi:MAG TPA: FMN-dependent NADH-azoreductase [Deltaproteobacteria bacterium]|nr:FMN-dependent NADH-azoreductase [Deltaproteobacteria bacterium]
MSKLLYIQGSPRGDRSSSIAVADAFVNTYKERHPDDDINVINLFQMNLPSFDGPALQAKYTILHGRQHSDAELTAWRAIEAVIGEFTSADKYVFAVPMWNFNIPYRLKQYIDVIVQPSYTFSFSPDEGYSGLVTNKPVFIAYARGGEYPAGSDFESFDLQTKYLELILGFIGFTDVRKVVVEPTLGESDSTDERLETAIKRAQTMAESF